MKASNQPDSRIEDESMRVQSKSYFIAFCSESLTIKAFSNNLTEIAPAITADDNLLDSSIQSLFSPAEITTFKATSNHSPIQLASKKWKNYEIYISKVSHYINLNITLVESLSDKNLSNTRFLRFAQQLKHAKVNVEAIYQCASTLHETIMADRVVFVNMEGEKYFVSVEITSPHTDKIFEGFKIPTNDFPKDLLPRLQKNHAHYTSDLKDEGIAITATPEYSISTEHIISPNLTTYHRKYFNALGAKRLLLLPLLVKGALYGTFICYFGTQNLTQKKQNQWQNTQLFTEILSAKIEELSVSASLKTQSQRNAILTKLSVEFAKTDNVFENLLQYKKEFLELLNAHSVMVFVRGEIHKINTSIPDDKLRMFLFWLDEKHFFTLFDTQTLHKEFPSFLSLKKDYCGLLAVRLENTPDSYLIWFKKEINKVETWVGNPLRNTSYETIKPNSTPNWKTIISGESEPWQDEDRKMAITLGNLLGEYLTKIERGKKHDNYLQNHIHQFSSELYCVFNQKFKLKEISHSVENLLGYHPDSFKREWPKVIKDSIYKETYAKYRTHLKNKQQKFSFTLPLRHKEGHYLYFNFNFIDYSDSSEIQGVVCHAKEVSETLRLQKRLSKYKTILNISTNGILILSASKPSYKVIYANPAYTKITGFEYDEIIGRPFPFMQFDQLNNQSIHQIQEALKKQNTYEALLQKQRKDGSEYWNYLQLAPIVNQKKIDSFIVVMTDVTYKRETEEKLNAYMGKLRKSNEELQMFAYVASHDLQEPLRTISGFTELIAEMHQGNLGEETDEYIDFILQATHRMRNLIQDLLLFSRVSTAKEFITEVDLNQVVIAAIKNLKSAIEEQKAIVTYDVLPAVFANQSMILQVFQNILSNALKYRREEQSPKVHIRLSDYDDSWLFSIEDNGIGIDPQYFERIFVIFQRLHTKEQYSGTGIGLAICKKIIERYGGRIWLESEPQKGTTFHFTIPKTLNLQ